MTLDFFLVDLNTFQRFSHYFVPAKVKVLCCTVYMDKKGEDVFGWKYSKKKRDKRHLPQATQAQLSKNVT